MQKWYYVGDADKLGELRKTLPLAKGEPRYSNAGTRFIASLTKYVEGAITQEEALARMNHVGWRRADED